MLLDVFFTDGHTMVAIPGIKHGFPHVAGHSSCLEQWGLGVMGFPYSKFVQWLEVHCSSWLAICLGAYNHATAPRDCFQSSNYLIGRTKKMK